MPRKLVLCLDGTSNHYCRDNTNVIKLAALLDKGATDQQLYYQPGIGTIAPPGVFTAFWKWFLTRLDLAFATLLKYHVQDAYRFLMRYYDPGDEIFIFGFSRGAYTARVVAGMLCKVGLLERGNEELVPFAWEIYAKEQNNEESNGFRNTFARKLPVAFIGVWDTVSSVRYLGGAQHFAFTTNNPIVTKVRHAVALDERRAYFRQNLWTDKPPPEQDVVEMWFPGVHCDVGGGYLEEQSGLSKIALKWMVDELRGQLKLHPNALAEMIPEVDTKKFATPSVTGRMHRSLRELWYLIEIVPKRVSVRQKDGSFEKRWIIPFGHRRQVPATAKIHPSVDERMRLDSQYRPPNLPARPQATGNTTGAPARAG